MSPMPPWHAGSAPAREDRDANRLFVAGIPLECSDGELEALVTQLEFSVPPSQSQLLECRVLSGRGCGYLRFSSWQAASEAMQNLDGREVSGWPQPLRVRWAEPKSSRAAGSFTPAPAPAPVRPLDQAQNALTAALSAVGAAVQKQHGTGSGVASLLTEVQNLLASNNAAELGAALEAQGIALGGLGGQAPPGAADIDPNEEHVIRGQGLDPKRLFVGQLTRELTDQNHLVSIFQAFGAIEQVRFLQDKGVAYIQFDSFVAAKHALDSLSGRHFPGVSREQGLNISFSRLR